MTTRRQFLVGAAACALAPSLPALPAQAEIFPLYGTSPAMLCLKDLREMEEHFKRRIFLANAIPERILIAERQNPQFLGIGSYQPPAESPCAGFLEAAFPTDHEKAPGFEAQGKFREETPRKGGGFATKIAIPRREPIA